MAFITNNVLFERPAGLFSPVASVRREIIIPAGALAARGITTHVISLPAWPAQEVAAIAAKADRIVYGKLLRDVRESADHAYKTDAMAYREVLTRTQGARKNLFCFADDHFADSFFAAFYDEVAADSRAWITSSEELQQRLRQRTQRPVLCYPEIAETERSAPRTLRRRLRDRVAVWTAQRARIGLEPWRVKLLWFGHRTNAQSLLDVIPQLESLAKDVPLRLECVTERGSLLEDLPQRSSDRLQLLVSPWSLEYMTFAFDECDAVILPQLVNDPQKRAKSNNRLIDSLNAGRFVIAQPIPSYEKLREYAWIGDSIGDGLRWLLRHPEEALRRIIAGQQYIAKYHSRDALADFWLRALDLEEITQSATDRRSIAPVKLNLGCGDKILDGYVNVDVAPARAGMRPDVICDLHRLAPFGNDTVDEILAVHVVEHFWRWEVVDVLREWVRVLKPGAPMILECPNLFSACEQFLADPDRFSGPGPEGQKTMWVFYGDPRWRDPLMVHRWGYTPRSLAQIMAEAGLTALRQEPAQFKLREPRDMRMVGIKPRIEEGSP